MPEDVNSIRRYVDIYYTAAVLLLLLLSLEVVQAIQRLSMTGGSHVLFFNVFCLFVCIKSAPLLDLLLLVAYS